MSILKSSRREFIYSGAAFVVLGVLMCLRPVGTAGVMCVIAGIALMVSGVMKAAAYFRKREYNLMPRMDFAGAALQAVVGLLLVIRPTVFIELVPFILGMMILVNSVFQVQTAMELKRIGYGSWWHHLAAGLVCGAVALVMMFDPFGSYRVIAVVMGLAFIVDGAADLWMALYLNNKLRKLGLL